MDGRGAYYVCGVSAGGLLPINDVRTGTVCTTTSDERGSGQTATSVDLVRHRRSILRPQTETLLNSYKNGMARYRERVPDFRSGPDSPGGDRIRASCLWHVS
jgi:hypothetical protein